MNESLTMNETSEQAIKYEPEVVSRLLSESVKEFQAEPCDCQYCRRFAHPMRNVSELAKIDVYSLPDENEH